MNRIVRCRRPRISFHRISSESDVRPEQNNCGPQRSGKGSHVLLKHPTNGQEVWVGAAAPSAPTYLACRSSSNRDRRRRFHSRRNGDIVNLQQIAAPGPLRPSTRPTDAPRRPAAVARPTKSSRTALFAPCRWCPTGRAAICHRSCAGAPDRATPPRSATPPQSPGVCVGRSRSHEAGPPAPASSESGGRACLASGHSSAW